MADPQFHDIHFGGYPYDMLLCVGATPQQIIAKLEELGDRPTKREQREIGRHLDSDAFQFLMRAARRAIVSLREFDGGPSDHGLLVHELFHSVWQLMDEVGVIASEDSEEAFAYALQDITRNALIALRNSASEAA